MEHFTFGDLDSRDYAAYVFDSETDSAPQREYQEVVVPGRNGTLLIDGKRWENLDHPYIMIIYDEMEDGLALFRDTLASMTGYHRLEDTLHPDEFYMATYAEPFVPVIQVGRDMCKFELKFNRKPQRFLKSGEEVTTLTASGSIHNPTNNEAKPLLRVYGTGQLGIGDVAITISEADEYTDIDCEIGEAYKGTTSCNKKVTVSDIDFPGLHVGDTGISLGSGITKVEITPRWFRL